LPADEDEEESNCSKQTDEDDGDNAFRNFGGRWILCMCWTFLGMEGGGRKKEEEKEGGGERRKRRKKEEEKEGGGERRKEEEEEKK
jgi:hypothetical protein